MLRYKPLNDCIKKLKRIISQEDWNETMIYVPQDEDFYSYLDGIQRAIEQIEQSLKQDLTREDIICLLSDYVMQDEVSEDEAKVAAEFAGMLASFERRD